jgi:hypothetical protein
LSAAVLALIAGTAAAPAATLIAVPSDTNSFFSGFQINFDDSNGNGLVDLSEITLFSGVMQTEFELLPPFQGLLLGMPAIDGFTVAGIVEGSGALPGLWVFSGTTVKDPQTLDTPAAWEYSFAIETPAPIPLPSAAWLMAAALTGLAALRGRRPFTGCPRATA